MAHMTKCDLCWDEIAEGQICHTLGIDASEISSPIRHGPTFDICHSCLMVSFSQLLSPQPRNRLKQQYELTPPLHQK